MLPKIAVIISPNWRDYAAKYLAENLKSLAAQNYQGERKLFLVDNASSAESLALLEDLVKRHWTADYQIIANQNNDGFAKGNNDALKVALAQNFDYLFVLNMDTELAENCLSVLVASAVAEKIGAVQARLMLSDDKEKINSLGNITHFLGFGYSKGYKDRFGNCLPAGKAGKLEIGNSLDICYPSGAAVLLKAEALRQVGLFDEEFWMYNEDQDLGWRLALAGWRSVLAPEAIVYHKYKFAKNLSQYYWLDRNRLIAILKNYRLATLLLLAPAGLIMEIGLVVFAAANGWLKEKIKVYQYFLLPRTWLYLIKARREAQTLRRVSDRQIVKLFSGRILYQEIDSPFLRLGNLFFSLYWFIAKMLIWW